MSNNRRYDLYLLDAHARANRLPAKQEKVGEALLKRLGEGGQCDPSHRTLVAYTGVSESTVERALNRMRDLGLLHWQRRLVRAGWRAGQTSNQYVLTPEAPAPMITVRPSRQLVSCGRQSDGETRFIEIQRPAIEVETARKALERVRLRMEARMLGKGCRMLPAI